jgi:DnaK suppressor protein
MRFFCAELVERVPMMSDKDLQRFQQLLADAGARLRSDYQHLTDEALESHADSRSPTHLAELGTDAYEQEFSLRFAESDQHILEEIDAALERIQNGSFGVCESCLMAGRPRSKAQIPRTRLREIPYARNCVECERERERQEDLRPGDSPIP